MAMQGPGSNVAGDGEALHDNQAAQREMVERARSLPGVAEMVDVYSRLSAYSNVMVNVQPSQVRNATGGNPG